MCASVKMCFGPSTAAPTAIARAHSAHRKGLPSRRQPDGWPQRDGRSPSLGSPQGAHEYTPQAMW
eukprot:7387956-Prymnesium_polylepis.3